MNSAAFKPQLTPDFVVRSLQLKVPVVPRPHIPFTQVITDSRHVQPGCLFVALKGDNVDGHDFIEAAVAKGARGILCRRGTSISSLKETCIFPVEDPLASYRRLAAAWRREFSIPLIAVAGSAGKTTTKEFLAAILKGKWLHVLKTKGSQNGFVGIPMTLLELRPEHDAAIIEVGIDEIDAMQQHMNLIGANGAVLTAIGPEHLVNLRDIPTVAREEGIALSHVSRSGGLVAINLDDPWIRPHINTLREGRKIPFSLKGATTPLDMISGQLSANGRELTFQGLGISSTTVSLPLLGTHNASNLLAAIAIAAGYGLTAEEIQTGLQTFQGAEGRSEIRELPGSTPVVCDYYNAQPASMEAAFDLLTQIAAESQPKKTRWICLGDMLELGPTEETFHRDLARKILELQIENVLLYGPRMEFLFQELNQGHHPAHPAAVPDDKNNVNAGTITSTVRTVHTVQGYLAHFNSHSDLAQALTQKVKAGDAILIKGSRGMKMEEVWKILEPYAKSRWSQSLENKNPTSHP